MLLNEKVFVFESDLDMNKANINILVNGKDDSLAPKYIFKDLELEHGKLSGYSILEFYKVDKGSLWDKENNEIAFYNKDKKIPIVKVRDPLAFINAPLEVNLQYVKDVSSLLGLVEIEKTVSGLSNSEKKILHDDREREYTVKQLAQKEKEAKEAEAKEAEAKEAEAKEAEAKEAEAKEAEAKEAEQEKVKAEEAAKEHAKQVKEEEIPSGEDIISEKEYKLIFRKYQRMSFKEYKSDEYRFFYTEDRPDSENPFILAKRDRYYQRLDGSLIAEDEKGVEYEFSDDKDKVLTLKDDKIEILEL